MAIGLKGWQEILERRLELRALAPTLVQRGIGGDSVNPAPKRRSPFERRAPVRQREKDVLQDLLGVSSIAGNAERQSIDRRTVALRQRGEGLYLPTTQRGQELEICDNAVNMHKARPAAFEAKVGSGYVCLTFKSDKR